MKKADIRTTYDDLRIRIEDLYRQSASRQTAVMFSDLVGSTAYKSQRDQVLSLIKTYRHNAEIEEQVEKLGGRVIKSLGDGVLSTFSIDQPEDIALPVNAAIRIQNHFHSINEHVGQDERILTRIGISCGTVIDFTTLNPKGKAVNDPQGSTVDLAARLCSLAKATQIVCDGKSVDLLTQQTATRFDCVGPTLRWLKGFSAEKIPVYVIKWSSFADSSLDDPNPAFSTSGFLTTDFVLTQVSQSNSVCRVVGHSHRHFCDNIELYNIVMSKVRAFPKFLFEMIFLNPFSPFKHYSELVTRRGVADLKPVILQNIISACRLFKELESNVRVVCSQYPMAIPFVQCDDSIHFSLPFRSLITATKREGVVDGPYFSTEGSTKLGERLLRNFESDPRIEIPIREAADGKIDLETLLAPDAIGVS